MLTVAEIIARVRATTHDEQETGYTDDTLLGFTNDGIHFLRRLFMDINPLLLADLESTGTLKQGDNEIIPRSDSADSMEDMEELVAADFELDDAGDVMPTAMLSTRYKLSNICDLRVDGRRLQQVKITEVPNTERQGVPMVYCLVGHSRILVFPKANRDYSYSLVAVKDMESLTSTSDRSPFPREVDDFLYEYVTVRASLTNEFDMSQENTVMASIIQQVEQYTFNLSPVGVQTNGYWDAPYLAGYKRRGRW